MTTAARQQLVRRLEPGSFDGSVYGREDIFVLQQGIYEAAQQAKILPVIARDHDLLTYQLVREEVREAPPMPAPGAAANVVKRYELMRTAYTQQNEALNTLKGRVLATLDQTALRVVEQPVHGALLLSITDILNALREEYGRMTNRELKQLKNRWAAMKWDASTDLISFLAEFAEATAFLAAHDFAPPQGDQVVTMQEAVEHVPAFAQPANHAFFLEFPAVQQQTLTNLSTVYRRVYREVYAHSTAAQHHVANQVTHSKPDLAANDASPDDVIMTGIIASARASLNGTVLTQAMIDSLLLEIPRTIQRCVRGPAGDDQQPQTKKPRRNTRAAAAAERAAPPKLRKGYCPIHQNSKHTWDQCQRNPDNEM